MLATLIYHKKLKETHSVLKHIPNAKDRAMCFLTQEGKYIWKSKMPFAPIQLGIYETQGHLITKLDTNPFDGNQPRQSFGVFLHQDSTSENPDTYDMKVICKGRTRSTVTLRTVNAKQCIRFAKHFIKEHGILPGDIFLYDDLLTTKFIVLNREQPNLVELEL